jgi:hypothetical protein
VMGTVIGSALRIRENWRYPKCSEMLDYSIPMAFLGLLRGPDALAK